MIYFILDGLTSPSFSTYTYFFLMDVIGISKFWFAMLILIGQFCLVISVLIYEAFLKTVEVRTLLFYNVIFKITGAFLALAFAERWNLAWGINDYFFLIFTDVVFATIATAFHNLPIMGMFAKLTPKKVEATMFAFFTGTMNLD